MPTKNKYGAAIEVKLKISGRDDVTVNGLPTCHPQLAITPRWDYGHACEDQFCVTHIPTGEALAHFLGIRRAIKLAGAMGGLLPWDADYETIRNEFYKLPKELQTWARSWRYGA